ncbi:hypothetical protein [Methylobacterium durans]|uniref:hypothetical protein n=1 Tax=Methylobacterium durans TaxID=2202825 RepID=UPI001F1F600D|nr:hypothetical protein [Methylobacterium durans]
MVSVHSIADASPDDVADTVALAVRRDEAGLAQLISVAHVGNGPRLSSVLSILAQMGATEMHVHRLAGSAGERMAIVGDLLTPENPNQLAIFDREESGADAVAARAAHDAAAHRFAIGGKA